MQKDELTDRQLQNREMIVERLTSAGWKGTASNRLFDKGKSARCEARMTFKNSTMKLTVTYFADKELVYFGLYDTLGKGVSIATNFENMLEEWLDLIISFQNELSSDNYKYYIEKIVKKFPSVFVEIEEEGELTLIPLLLDNET